MKIKSASENLDEYEMMKASQDMFDIVAPINNLLEITHFSYHRVYQDHSRIHLSTHPCFIDAFHKNEFYQITSTALPFNCYKSGYYIVDNILTEDVRVVIDASLALFDYFHPFMIIKKYDTYCEFFYFSTRANNDFANNFYINNLDVFENFILYFRNKAIQLLKRVDNERFFYPTRSYGCHNARGSLDDLVDFNKSNFYDEIKLKKYFIPEFNTYLSLREIQCLIFISKGYNQKTTARRLGISPRTVEIHINHVKEKFKLPIRQALVDSINDAWFSSSFHFFENEFTLPDV